MARPTQDALVAPAMYAALLILLLACAGWLAVRGLRRRDGGLVAAGGTLAGATVLFFALLSFLGELYWYQALGYERRFWTVILTQVALGVVGLAAGAAVVRVLTAGLSSRWSAAGWTPALVGGVFAAGWCSSRWELALRWWHSVPTRVEDPVLGRDTGFYLFILPFYDALWILGLALTVVAIAAWTLYLGGRLQVGMRGPRPVERSRTLPAHLPGGVFLALAALGLVLAWGRWLAVYHLLFSSWGAVTGPGWTDVHVRLPANYAAALVAAAVGVGLLVPGVRRAISGRLSARLPHPELTAMALPWGLVAVVWALALLAVPGLVQWLVVEPNEISFERPYIAHNISFTRRGFGLDQVEERQFPALEELRSETLESNRNLLDEVRLWDWRALDAVYRQFQEIRLYYEFRDPDIDRYTIGDRYRQVMVAGREMEPDNLPEASQTFVNRRFKYTHGYGLTLAPVSDFTPEGLPRLLVKDIPPVAEFPQLAVDRPEIYYGELTRDHVYVDTEEAEFDYPRGDENAFTRYQGDGGVPLRNLWRKFVFGWKFDGTRFFLSSYPRPESRVLFHRQVRARAQLLAPFLRFDEDPYLVLADGRLYWILDAYTVSSFYPYSERFSSNEVIEYQEGEGSRRLVNRVNPDLDGSNYVRNSVKVLIDAYDGRVRLYVFDPEDPLIQVWRRVFPGLLAERGEMPPELQRHVRFPEDLLLTQGLVYAKYHMEDPEVFYNQEDLWVRATEKYYGAVQPVEPYYVMWRPPGSEQVEFVLILPFTPKNRQVLIGWIAGMCDGENYGRFLAYKFPKEKRVLGPQQVETKIDQDPFLSGQLSLWDQRGSRVIRGNVLAIPIDDTLLYVEPIYLQAETAAYPELRLVAVMHGDRLSYAESFDEALAELAAGERGVRTTRAPRAEVVTEGPPQEASALVKKARRAFSEYLRLQAGGRFVEAARELETLETALEELERRFGSTSP